jgi:hypothetical protein
VRQELHRVNADHRLASVAVGAGLLVEVPELPVAVRMLLALQGFRVALQAEPVFPQQISDDVSGNRMPLAGQFRSKVPR